MATATLSPVCAEPEPEGAAEQRETAQDRETFKEWGRRHSGPCEGAESVSLLSSVPASLAGRAEPGSRRLACLSHPFPMSPAQERSFLVTWRVCADA